MFVIHMKGKSQKEGIKNNSIRKREKKQKQDIHYEDPL